MPLILKNKHVSCLNLGTHPRRTQVKDLSEGIFARNNNKVVGGENEATNR